jgi:hypothetical protein
MGEIKIDGPQGVLFVDVGVACLYSLCTQMRAAALTGRRSSNTCGPRAGLSPSTSMVMGARTHRETLTIR